MLTTALRLTPPLDHRSINQREKPAIEERDHAQSARDTLKTLAVLRKASLDELHEFAEDENVDSETLRARLRWAELLNLVRRVGQETWEFDAVVARLLENADR